MLLSMTGHGEAHHHQDGMSVAAEVRTINNRYLKLSFRASEGYQSLETPVESVVRQHVRRGSIQVNLRVEREATASDYRLNEQVLAGYLSQLEKVTGHKGPQHTLLPAMLLSLPGVIREPGSGAAQIESEWPIIEGVIVKALQHLQQMRSAEGASMAADLAENAQVIARELAAVESRSPLVVEAYRTRLKERLNKLLNDAGVEVQPTDIIREVGIFAERSDIAEEIVRLRSHLEQFESFLSSDESSGRKLEFVTQEMFRETNTIGSKANDAQIARHVIEMKSAIERMREMIQNVE